MGLGRRNIAMNDDESDLDHADENGLTYEVSDEALEASGSDTQRFTVSLSQPGLFTCAVGCC
jgi:hypothetical protein